MDKSADLACITTGCHRSEDALLKIRTQFMRVFGGTISLIFLEEHLSLRIHSQARIGSSAGTHA